EYSVGHVTVLVVDGARGENTRRLLDRQDAVRLALLASEGPQGIDIQRLRMIEAQELRLVEVGDLLEVLQHLDHERAVPRSELVRLDLHVLFRNGGAIRPRPDPGAETSNTQDIG